MKTTIDLSDVLFREARRVAREHGTTLRSLVESGLRHEIASRRGKKRSFRLRDESFGGKGLQTGIDLSDWSRVRRMIYEGRGG